MRASRSNAVIVTVLATLLATHATCVCASPMPSTAAPALRPTTAEDAHACCRPHARPARHREHVPGCRHCVRVHATPPDAGQLTAPTWKPVRFFVPPALVSSPPAVAAATIGVAARAGAPPTPRTPRPCVLLL